MKSAKLPVTRQTIYQTKEIEIPGSSRYKNKGKLKN